MLEIEKKAYLAYPQKVLKALQNLDAAVYKGKIYKSDIYFSTHKVKNFKDIQSQKKIFRVRYIGEDIYLTLKYKTLVGNTEVNQEIEVPVIDNDKSKQELKAFFQELDIKGSYKGLVEEVLSIKSYKEWIVFWERLGFFYLLSKEKKTELFTLYEQNKQLSLEWNEITNLGFFLEIEGLSQNQEEVQDYIYLINKYMNLLGITENMEEPRLYLELLFIKLYPGNIS